MNDLDLCLEVVSGHVICLRKPAPTNIGRFYNSMTGLTTVTASCLGQRRILID